MATTAPSHWLAAQTALGQRDLGAAERHLQAWLATTPDHAYARVLLAGVMRAGGRLREACAQLLLAADTLPDDAATLCRIAQALLSVGETAKVREVLQHSAIAACSDGATLATFAHLHQMLGEHPQSLALMDRARALGYDNPDFRYFRSIQLQFNGRLEEAAQELEACLRLGPTYGRASLTLARLRRQSRESNHLPYLRQQLQRVQPGSEDHAAFEFAHYKELEDLGEYDDAWHALQRANAIMHQRLRHDPQREARQYQRLTQVWDTKFFASPQTVMDDDGPRPIFVIGLPRSGTTVLERMLGNHSQVVSAGELGDFGHSLRYVADQSGRGMLDDALLDALPSLDYPAIGRRYLAQTRWRAQDTPFFIDKLPANHIVAGLIAKALPNALLLHLSRDPQDVCFSNYRALFGDSYAYSYDLATLARHHAGYRRLMTHWHRVLPGRILDVDYQKMVQSPEATLRQVLEFCGLPLETHLTDLTRNQAPSATLSSVQVRESVHARGLGEWHRYRGQPAWQRFQDMLSEASSHTS